jgi:hypothetical protein
LPENADFDISPIRFNGFPTVWHGFAYDNRLKNF